MARLGGHPCRNRLRVRMRCNTTQFFLEHSMPLPNYAYDLSQSVSNDSDQKARRISDLVVGTSGLVLTPVVLILAVFVIFVYRAYKTTFQRLILYHILLVLLCEITFVLQIEAIFRVHQRWICVIVTYLYLYFPIAWYIYTTAMVNCLFLLALRVFRGKSNIWQGSKLAEFFCIVLTIILPMAYLWKPITDGSSVALTCDKLESSTWYEDAMILSMINLVMCTEVILLCITLGCMFCFLRRRLQSDRLTALLKHLLYHSGINAAIMALNALVMAYCSYRYFVHPSEQLSFALYLIISLEEPVFFFVSVLFQSVISISHQSSHKSCTAVCSYCTRNDGDSERYMVNTDRNENRTNPISHPLDQPSHTYFSVPYTGAFTQVTSGEHRQQSIGEHTPLMINNNDGYAT